MSAGDNRCGNSIKKTLVLTIAHAQKVINILTNY
jgi:hypothetical protein